MKRIIRSRKDRIVTGVCGGFAEYFGLDPSLIRLGWIFFTFIWRFRNPGIFFSYDRHSR